MDSGLDYPILLGLLTTGALLILVVYELLLLSDLECDMINNIDFCRKVNKFIQPEYIATIVVTVVFLLSGKWILFLLNVPLAGYHGYKLMNYRYKLDATKIFSTMARFSNIVLAKLAIYMVWFFTYLFLLLYYLLKE